MMIPISCPFLLTSFDPLLLDFARAVTIEEQLQLKNNEYRRAAK